MVFDLSPDANDINATRSTGRSSRTIICSPQYRSLEPSAREALVKLQQPAATETAKRFQARVSDVVSMALRDHEIIAKEGLAAYYRRNPIVKGVPPSKPERGSEVAPPYETQPAGLITGADKAPEVVYGLRKAPPVPKPAMNRPHLPPRPAIAKPLTIPKPSLTGPPPIKEPEPSTLKDR